MNHTRKPWSMSKVQKDNAIYCGNSTKVFSEEVEIYPPSAGKDEEQSAGPIAIVSTVEGMGNAELIRAAPETAARLNELIAVLEDLIDSEACSYDHHGYCQSHSLHEKPCPHERAKKLLAKPD